MASKHSEEQHHLRQEFSNLIKQHTIYTTRWYVLIIVALSNVLNNNFWAYWGSIAQSAKSVYDWTDNTIFILVNLGNGAAFLATLAGCYFVDRQGIRASVLVCYGCMVLTTVSKIITMETYPATILIGIGQIFNGIANSVTGAIPPVVSEVWFPLNERTTATAIAALAAGLGSATTFIIGPLAVSSPVMNGSVILFNETNISTIRTQIKHLNFAMFGVCSIILFICIVYLPAKPPTPPSVTAASDRYGFKEGILNLMRRPNMWYIGAMYGVSMGSFGSWASVLNIILHPLGISQAEAGWMVFSGCIGGVLGGIAMGKIADIFKRRMKVLLVIDFILVVICVGWFTFQCNDILPRSTTMLFVAAIGLSVFFNAITPIFIEMACEVSYPIAEGLTSGLLSMFINFTATIFLLINLIPNIGTAWMNWWVTGVPVVTVPLLLMFRVKYQRVDIDTAARSENQDVN